MNTSAFSTGRRRAAGAAALAFSLICAGGTVVLNAMPAAAQIDAGASAGYYDGSNDEAMRHVVSGTIANASPYRILLAVGRSRTVDVDLNHGTTIRPMGTTLAAGMRIEAHGHWSKGTFIADRVILES